MRNMGLNLKKDCQNPFKKCVGYSLYMRLIDEMSKI